MAEREDASLIEATLSGDVASFEPLIQKYQPRVFATARRYARRESEVEDIVQEVFIKAFQKLRTYRGDAPFEHWLMKLSVRTCYDFLRAHQRSREISLAELGDDARRCLDLVADQAPLPDALAAGAKEVVELALSRLAPASRLVLTLLELEDRSVKEISALTGWSVPLVKVRAFRARRELRKWIEQLSQAHPL